MQCLVWLFVVCFLGVLAFVVCFDSKRIVGWICSGRSFKEGCSSGLRRVIASLTRGS